MPTFPLLSTGVVSQFPTEVSYEQAVQVLRYVDGQDQRFLRQGRQFRRWQIKLNLLTEIEIAVLEDFFKNQMGDYTTFEFYDPFSTSVVPNCVLGNASIVSEYLALGRCTTSLWVVETNG